MKVARFLCLLIYVPSLYALPSAFVYLRDVNPGIQQEMRYAASHNFMGRPVKGYKKAECILTRQAALALSSVQKELEKSSLSLKVYDCYRPVTAVADFMAWSRDPREQRMKQEFYPRVNKADLFRLGYIAEKSGHSRGSTVDLTIVSADGRGIDMGTGFDYLDEMSHNNHHAVSARAYNNRLFLRQIMVRHGFVPYEMEWWHFTLQNEPYADKYFNFIVE